MTIQQILSRHQPTSDNLLNILHDVQDHHPQNYITSEAMDQVAVYLNMTKSSVYGVVDYYSMLSLKPRGRHIVRVCISPVCHILKSKEIIHHLETLLGIGVGETTADQRFTLEVAECLGQCQEAPSMMINNQVFNKLTFAKIKETLSQFS